MTAPQRSETPWACPDSRLLLPADADREEWLAARKAGVGGSDYGVLLGMSTWCTTYKLWQIKTGRLDDDEANAMMARGSDLEPIIRTKFEQQSGLATRRAGLQQSRINPRMLFSPDALVEDGSTAEFKLVSSFARAKWIDPDTGERRPPALYEWQVRMGMAVTGRSKGYIAALDADSWQLEIFEVHARPLDFQFISDVVDDFWAYIDSDTAPPIDYAQADTAEMLDRFPEIIDPESIVEASIPEQVLSDKEEWDRLSAIISAGAAAQKERDKLKVRLQMMIGEHEYLGIKEGDTLRPIFRWKTIKQTTFREKDLKADHPGLCQQYIIEGTTRRFEAVKPKATKKGSNAA